MISSRIKTLDIVLFLLPVMLVAVSLSVIYSLVTNTPDSGLVLKQGISLGIGIFLMLIAAFSDYRFFKGTSWVFYLGGLLLLLYVDFFGVAAGGAMRWINMGFFQLQPSEVAKFFLVITMASYFSTRVGKLTLWRILFSVFILIPPLVLVLKEPDLGTALVLCFIYAVMLFASRPTRLQSIVIIGGFLFLVSIFLLSVFKVGPFTPLVHDYQRNRILTFMDPNLDPLGKGYQVSQAQIAIGSGGIFGKGLGKGSQSQLQYLPKPQTDFIFSGISEAFGFLGTGVVLAMFCLLIIKVLQIANLARDNYGLLVCFGVAAMLLFQVIINVGMNLGLAPVTGIPLPFSSYGGSALIVYFFLIGLVQSIFIRHRKISF